MLHAADAGRCERDDASAVKTRRFQVGLFFALSVALVVPVAASPAAGHATLPMRSLDTGVLEQLNAVRAANHLLPLKTNPKLVASAAQHAREMAADGYFAHPSADETAFWKRIDRWYPSTGDRYWSVGENLLWSSPDVDAAGALLLWMQSPEHRSNILAARWREIGVASVHVAAAPGVYGGRQVTIVATDFGVREPE